ncbi:MAG: hypothetical protein RL885_08100 [Planctomycetota bacterium]
MIDRVSVLAPARHGTVGRSWRAAASVLVAWLVLTAAASAQEPAPLRDPVSRLARRIESGEVRLARDSKTGYLRSLLEHLDIPISSQTLVFSKTSLQIRHISPHNPRALYFSDDVYVGWVPGGDLIEIGSVDPQRGAIFYALSQAAAEKPRLEQPSECSSCHESSRTENVPGFFLRSVYPAADGQPILAAGTHTIDQNSPFDVRWGGWYVTGLHGDARHLGNVVAQDEEHARELDVEAGANVTDLSKYFRTERYLSPHSDLVALLVLEHQVKVHNLIARATHETGVALRYQAEMNAIFGDPPEHRSESTLRRLDAAARNLVDDLLFLDEPALPAPVRGTSTFAEELQAEGRRDSKGRSLRDLDLERRVFRYPCSFLVYSDAFRAMPAEMQERVWSRIWLVLTGRDEERSGGWSKESRLAAKEILTETYEGLPSYWND